MKASAKQSLGLYELKQHKPSFEKCFCFLDQRKHAKMQWLQDLNRSNVHNPDNVRHEASSRFRNKKKECLKAQIDKLETKFKNVNMKIHRTIILPVVLYGCETWSHTLRKERRLRMLENRLLRRIFGPKRVEVTGEWIKLHNEELNGLYSPDIRAIESRKMRWVGHVTRMGSWWGNLKEGTTWKTQT